AASELLDALCPRPIARKNRPRIGGLSVRLGRGLKILQVGGRARGLLLHDKAGRRRRNVATMRRAALLRRGLLVKLKARGERRNLTHDFGTHCPLRRIRVWPVSGLKASRGAPPPWSMPPDDRAAS